MGEESVGRKKRVGSSERRESREMERGTGGGGGRSGIARRVGEGTGRGSGRVIAVWLDS